MLPTEVITTILQHVPQQQRLGQCALVSRSWRVAASTSVDVQPAGATQLTSLCAWLKRHGSNVADLRVAGIKQNRRERLIFPIPFLQLRQLQCLHLRCLNISVSNSGRSSSSSLHSGTWADLTALTSLRIISVRLDNSGDGPELDSITSLRRLVLNDVNMLPSVAPLTQLTTLILETDYYGAGNEVKGIGHLSQLEHLKIADYSTSILADLPFSLTHLELGQVYRVHRDISNITAPRLGELTALVHLVLINICFAPQLLSNLVQLRHLRLEHCRLGQDDDGSGSVDLLLNVLSRLSQLECLDLDQSVRSAVKPVQQYTALVSSSALTSLDLRDCCLQDNAVLHMFKGRQCPALQSLQLGLQEFDLDDFGSNGVACSVCAEALEALAHACPALQDLQLLDNVVDPSCWEQLAALEDLTGLSKLRLAGHVISDDSIKLLTSLKLPHLQDLWIGGYHVEYLGQFTANGLWSLCGMTNLTRLVIEHGDLVCDDLETGEVEFIDKNGLTRLRDLMFEEFDSNHEVTRILLQEALKEMKARAEAAESKLYQSEQRVALVEQQLQQMQDTGRV